jgi:hypothetical protein
MNKKQTKVFVRILISAVILLFLGVFPIKKIFFPHSSFLPFWQGGRIDLATGCYFLCYLIPYLISVC